MPSSRFPLKLYRPSGSPLIPAGPESDVGRGPGPLMRASGNRIPEPRFPKKSAIAFCDAGFYTLHGFADKSRRPHNSSLYRNPSESICSTIWTNISLYYKQIQTLNEFFWRQYDIVHLNQLPCAVWENLISKLSASSRPINDHARPSCRSASIQHTHPP